MLLKELRTVLASNCDLVVATVPHRFSWNLPTERVGGSDALGWGEIVISTENRAFFQSFCPNPFFI